MDKYIDYYSYELNVFSVYPGSENSGGDNEISASIIPVVKSVSEIHNQSGNKSLAIIELAREVAKEKGIDEVLFIRIMLHESGANPKAVGDVNIPWKFCRSRGLFQINSCWWPEVSDRCAFDALCNINWAANMFKQGRVEIFNSWIK